MRNGNHTAHFIVSKFLNSNESLEYSLTETDCHVLRYLADLMDMTMSACNLLQVRISISQAIKFSRVPDKSLRRSISALLNLNLLSSIKRGSGIVGVYELGLVLKTWVTQTQAQYVDNSNLGHPDLGPRSNQQKPRSPRPTSNKDSNKDYNKERSPVPPPSSPPVDNFYQKHTFTFTDGEMTEAIQRGIHIQPCFDKFWCHLLVKGKKGFRREEWEKWFAGEKNVFKPTQLTVVESHYENQMKKHEEFKRTEGMPEYLRDMIKKLK